MENNVSDIEKIKKIGLRIAFYRKQRRMTQSMLAEKANISISYLSKIESAGTDVTCSLSIIYKLATALNMEAFQLMLPVNEDYLADDKEQEKEPDPKNGDKPK